MNYTFCVRLPKHVLAKIEKEEGIKFLFTEKQGDLIRVSTNSGYLYDLLKAYKFNSIDSSTKTS